jgi:hypothetical protein
MSSGRRLKIQTHGSGLCIRLRIYKTGYSLWNFRPALMSSGQIFWIRSTQKESARPDPWVQGLNPWPPYIFQSNMSLSRIENVAECCDVPATQQLHIWAANVLPLNIFFTMRSSEGPPGISDPYLWCHQQPPKLGTSVADYYFFATSRVQYIIWSPRGNYIFI